MFNAALRLRTCVYPVNACMYVYTWMHPHKPNSSSTRHTYTVYTQSLSLSLSHTHTHTRKHARTHACTHARTNTHKHTHKRTHSCGTYFVSSSNFDFMRKKAARFEGFSSDMRSLAHLWRAALRPMMPTPDH
jgi:hypothetical protein